jgi:mannobiose 2-epimerase
MTRLVVLMLLMSAFSVFAEEAPKKPIIYGISDQALRARRDQVQKHLSEVYGFWLDPAREDPKFGGMLYYLDADLQPTEITKKNIMMQLRMLFNYARGIKAGETKRFPDLSQRLEKQFAYLRDKFRDKDGTWFYELQRDGTPINPERKLMVAQVYVIYLLSEVYLMTGNTEALRLAEETFERIEPAYDTRHGGYRQRFDKPSFDKENIRKSCATNLHMLLALARLAAASPKPLYKERLMELYELLPRYVHPGSGNGYWALTYDWQPIPFDEGINNRTMYGHNAELIWYLDDAAPVLDRQRSELLPLLELLGRGLLQYGVAPDGAVYFFGPIDGPSDDRQVQWWAPIETMIALLRLYRYTGDPAYWEAVEKIADWTFKHFIPKDTPGAWYTVAAPDGRITDSHRGGYIWKSGFHEIRGLSILLEEMDEIARLKHETSAGQ